ncbi:hypothetical protein SAMN06265182_1306 [Persephonella hydrogeniphila]|uniref:Uncharacterized protein n=1 Tax=Persephonella hydrogeniphila TaxID=198703 RepID=A0A285NLF5_9AQUI|nr:hypothetical protein [Persephonella hydrogeniphila]SNZ08481.1 hypothetical protein SAMN06265182_1306 [Persephonella hydrogeniphila]
MGFFRYFIIGLLFVGMSYAQPFFSGKNEKIIIIGENVYFGKFFYFKKNPVKMINLPGGFILKVKSDKCPLGFILAERKYLQGYYDIKLESVDKEGKCITYVGNIPERKLIKDLTIGQIVLTYCEMDSYLNCDRGEIYWELYYFPSEKSK